MGGPPIAGSLTQTLHGVVVTVPSGYAQTIASRCGRGRAVGLRAHHHFTVWSWPCHRATRIPSLHGVVVAVPSGYAHTISSLCGRGPAIGLLAYHRFNNKTTKKIFELVDPGVSELNHQHFPPIGKENRSTPRRRQVVSELNKRTLATCT